MTGVKEETFTGELGVSFLQFLCSSNNTIFRPIRMFDVGIDGLIEPQIERVATGHFIGVQIKSGESFQRSAPGTYSFKGDKTHFEYWRRCTMPIVGVVFDPTIKRAVWINLTEISEERLKSAGPWSVRLSLGENELNSETLPHLIQSTEQTRINRVFDNSSTCSMLKNSSRSGTDLNEASITWEELVEVFLSLIYDDWTVAKAGYRICLYFPVNADDPRRTYLLNRLKLISDLQLVKIVSAMDTAMLDGADNVAENMCNLLGYVPDVIPRLERALEIGCFTKGKHTAAIQAIELITQESRADIWSKLS